MAARGPASMSGNPSSWDRPCPLRSVPSPLPTSRAARPTCGTLMAIDEATCVEPVHCRPVRRQANIVEAKLRKMVRYRALSGHSGVVAYELSSNSVVVEFRDGWKYEYTSQSAGAARVATMKRLAASGRGLSTFISQEARKAFARKFR